jgi:two-component system response regulator
MVSTILHVEDDPALRGVVELAFASFGFRGAMIPADSVAQTKARLEEATKSGSRIELIISDMNLPDGTGLDIVRDVRSSPEWKTTPVLILSGDVDPKTVGKAYALGANAYLDKAPRGRSLSEVLRSAYQHWTQDVVLPRAPEKPERIYRTLTRAMSIRHRHAELYQRLAELFSDTRSEATFWLSRALVESNVINLLAFLRNHVHDRDFTDVPLDQIADMQDELEKMLGEGERQLERGPLTRDTAYRLVIDLVTAANLLVLSRRISNLSPKVAVVMHTFHDFLVRTVHDVAVWIDLHATDPALRERAVHMRTRLAALTAQAA